MRVGDALGCLRIGVDWRWLVEGDAAEVRKRTRTFPFRVLELLSRIDGTMVKLRHLSGTVPLTLLDSLPAAELPCGQLEKQLKVLRQPLTEHMGSVQFLRAQAEERRRTHYLKLYFEMEWADILKMTVPGEVLENLGQGEPRHQSSFGVLVG